MTARPAIEVRCGASADQMEKARDPARVCATEGEIRNAMREGFGNPAACPSSSPLGRNRIAVRA